MDKGTFKSVIYNVSLWEIIMLSEGYKRDTKCYDL